MTTSSYLTVKALTKYIRRKFDADPHLRDVFVKGELSNVKIHSSGHIYFTLKDEAARITAAMFRGDAQKLKFKPEEGMMVYVRGYVNVYESAGAYQLYAQTMEPDGVGGLFIAFNQLKEKLQKEGLFNPQFKQQIPMFPKKVGVLTATTGAAIRDICTTISRRFPLAEIVIYPTLVQGQGAAPNIVKNIQIANQQDDCDVLIVGRGGGSIEDLWAFNEEIVARAIFESRIPIISAVGHETDTTIADFVADLRAPTPTAAAELAVPNQQELFQRVMTSKSQLHQMITAKIKFEQSRLKKLQSAYPLATPERLYRPFTEKLVQLDLQIERASKLYLMKKSSDLHKLDASIKLYSPKNALTYYGRQLDLTTNNLTRAVLTALQRNKDTFSSRIRTLEALNPLTIMNRGYTVTYKGEKVIKSISNVSKGDEISIHFHDGEAQATINNTKVEKKGE